MSDDWRQITAEWKGGTGFIGLGANGVSVQMGAIGNQPGVSPMEMLLLGLAGCTGMDIVSILEKKRQSPLAMKVVVRARRAADIPKVYTEIEVEYQIWGEGIEKKAIEQAIELSEEKYCSVGLMLSKAAPIRSAYRLLAPGEAA